MAFSVSTRSAVDGTGTAIPGGVVFIDESGAGTGPWIIAKTTIDPASVSVQFVLANNAAKCDISSINGTTTPTGHGTAAGALRVELPTDGTGQVNVANFPATQAVSGTVTVQQATASNLNATVVGTGTFAVQATQAGTWTVQQGGAPWSVTIPQSNVQIDYDTGAGTQNMTVWGIALPASGGSVAGGTATNPIRTDPTGTTTQPVSGTVTANQGGAPWSQNVTQWNGVALGSPSNYGTSPGAVSVMGVNAFVTNTVTVTGTVAATQSGAWTVNPTTAANWGVGATGAAVPANADYLAGNAITTLPTAATAGNLTGVSVDKFGRQVVLPQTTRDNIGTQTTTISTTTETTIVTAAASIFNDLLALIVSNTAASGSDTRIDFRDTTGGTVLFSLMSRGGQQPVGFTLGGVAIPQTSVNTNWTAQLASAVTDIRIYAVFAKNK
jgi:hypothetical protein